MRGWRRERRGARFLPYTVVTVALAVFVSLIVTSQGVENRVMDLNNSGVWVTNDSRALWGRANRSAGALDAALVDPNRESGGVNLDVFQDGEAVMAWNMTQLRMFPIDTRDAVAATTTPVGMGLVGAMAMNGGVIASITSDKGEVRTTPYWPTSIPDVTGLGADRPVAATLEVASGLQAGVDVAVDARGRVFAASTSGQWVMIDTAGNATYGTVGQSLRSVAVSLVGGVGVVTDPTTGDVYMTNGVHCEAGSGAVPQQPGDDGSRVIVATRTGLSAILLPGGTTTTLYTVPSTTPGTTPSGAMPVAEPVVMGSVVYGAWGGTPGHVVRLDPSGPREDIFPEDGSPLVKPTFRVNRGSVLLNDMANGSVFDVDEKWSMDNWEDVAPEATELSKDSGTSSEDSPRAVDDHVWARAGRTAVVHVLDNDVNPGTGIIAITAVSGPDADRVVVSPDGQTLVADVPTGQSEDLRLTYTITNRAVTSEDADEESTANLTISMRAPTENTLPYQSGPEGSDDTDPDFTVPSAGALSIAPAGWWRDADSDQVSVLSASVGDRIFPVTAQGLIQYTAPASPGQLTERLDYTVSDGYDNPVTGNVYIRVQSSSEVQSVPPVAMSDSVRGVAGQPVVFYPLDNDVPGADPLDKQAHLQLASPVGARVGMEVSTDLLTGAVTVTAQRAGAYFLDYVAGFGSGFSAGKIRVDIGTDDELVAMPDTAVIRGTVPVVVDLLANDRDRLGSVLTVTSATPRDPDQVRVGVIAGRWLRIDLVSSVVSSAATIIDYGVTNGVTRVTGQVSVTQTSLPEVNHVSVVDDRARVRVGDVTTISVLDNDSSESGEPLVLNDNVEGMTNAGQVRVEDPTAPIGQETLDVGQAFVDGNRIRYAAPTSGEARRVRIEYQAGVASGSPMTGYVWVDVVPEPVMSEATGTSQPATMIGNNVPAPMSIDTRVIVGDAVRVPVGIYGQDPDGDSVTVAGLRTPPKYGRVVEVGADYLTYESYPDVGNAGMDSFQFYVQDRFGAIGIGTVRVGLSAPHDVPPPLGVDDVVTAQPGVEVTVYPTSNDVVAIGTGQTQIVVDDPKTPVDQASASVAMVAPDADSPAVSLGYHLDAGGLAGTSAQIMVRSQVGYLNPPNVSDHAAEKIDGDVASVDVLDDAWDVDGPDDGIHIISVGGQATFDGSTVSVPVLDRGQVIPFQVEDGDGAQAMAVVFVPSLTDGRPTLVSGGLIRMDRNGTRQVNLNDYIESPRHQTVHLTLASQAWTAPGAYLDVSVSTDQQVTLQAKNDYVGPAALTVEVRDSPDATDPAALTGVVTIPVQIGAATPVLWCPKDQLELVQGGVARSVDVAEVCHAWMPTQVEIDALRFTGTWFQGGDAVTVTGRDQGPLPSDLLTLQALPESRPGVDSTLTVGVDGYDVTSQLTARVIAAPKPTLSVSSVTDVQQGTTVDVPVAMTSPMAGGVQNIVSVRPTSGPASAVAFDDRTIQVTPEAHSHGVLTFDVVGSDISDDTRADRQVVASFSVTVYGVPDPPSAPQPGTQLRSHSAVVTFIPGADNGAPILGYEVQWEGGTLSCGLNTTCEIPGLTNGTPYRFQVRAINKAGPSDWSEIGPEVIPNAIPGAVTGFTAASPGCGTVVLTWGTTQGEGTAPMMYHLTWGGATPVTVAGTTTTYTPTGLDNNQPYVFTIVAENEAGLGQLPVTVTSQSSCKPLWPTTQVNVLSQDMGDTAQIAVTWPVSDPQGPGPVTYTVTRTGPDGTKQFAPTTATTLGDTGDEITYDGQTYIYHVTATNATGGASHTSDQISGSFTAISAPASWSSVGGANAVKLEPTGTNGQATVSVASFPRFRDSSGEVRVVVGSQSVTLTPGSPSKTLNGFTNGSDLTADFTACNTQNMCNTAQRVTLAGGSYGPLTAPSVSGSPVTGQRVVCFDANGDGNGRGATLVVTATGGIGEVYRDTVLSVSNTCVDALSWDTDITLTAHLESVPLTPSRADSPSFTTVVHSSIGTPDPWADGSVQAKGNGTDGQVEVTASLPPLNGGSLQLSYTIDGGSPQTITPTMSSCGSGTCATMILTGWTNGQDHRIVLIASNGTNTSTSPAVTAHSYGPLGAPILTALPGQDTKACVQATTPSTGTNGEKALLSITTDTDHWESGLQVGAIDSGVVCFPAGDYNTQVEFRAQLITGPDLNRADSPVSTRVATSSIGTPGALSASNITWVATGVSGQARIELVGTLPAHNGGPGGSLRVDVSGVPGASISLTASSPSAYVNGLANGTPTTLTFTACNQANSCNTSGTTQKTITTAGPLNAKPVTVSITPPPNTIAVNKTVCADITAYANGADATLMVKNDIDSTTATAHGVGDVPAHLCATPTGANVPVVFTYDFVDTSTITPKRDPLLNQTATGYSPPDAGPMGVFQTGSETLDWQDTTVGVCEAYRFNPNGGDMTVTLIRVDNPGDETWDVVENQLVPADGPTDGTIVRICGTIPMDGRAMHFRGLMTDVSGYGRTADPVDAYLDIRDMVPMRIVSHSVSPSDDAANTNKEVCATFTADGGGGDVALRVSDSIDSHSTLESGDEEFSVTHCANPGTASTTVTFYAELIDPTFKRTTLHDTADVTSPPDPPPSCTFTVSGPHDVTIDFFNAPSDVQMWYVYHYSDHNAERCYTQDGSTTTECRTYTGNESDEITNWLAEVNLQTNQIDFTMRRNLNDVIATCTQLR